MEICRLICMFYNYVLSLQRQTKKQMNYEESNFIIAHAVGSVDIERTGRMEEGHRRRR